MGDEAVSTELYFREAGALRSVLMSVFTWGGDFPGICQVCESVFTVEKGLL